MYLQPNDSGYFGSFGGIFMPEILMDALEKLIKAYNEAKNDPFFQAEFTQFSQEYSGRPTPLSFAKNLTNYFGGAKIYIKREDLNHTGSHKFNNVLGQGLLAKRMGKKRIIAETGAGQHGVATATICAKLGFDCTIYMGAKDVQRQYPHVLWMKNLGAKVVVVEHGDQSLKDAINACWQDWINDLDDTYYLLGTAAGPHPYPLIVRDFQSIIGKEVKEQIKITEKKLPDYLIAGVGGGSNAIGLFYPFLNDHNVNMIGVEAGGEGIKGTNHSSRLQGKNGAVGVFQGYKSYFLQNDDGQILEPRSIVAGLDYVGIGPEHAYLKHIGRVKYTFALNKEAINALKFIMRLEGIIPALESAPAFDAAFKLAPTLTKEKIIVVNQSGRGDKDIFTIAEALEDGGWKQFLHQKVGI